MKTTSAVLLAGAAIAFLAIGCSKHDKETVTSEAPGPEPGVVQTGMAAAAATPAAAMGTATPEADPLTVAATDSLPPDIVATVSSPTAKPGEVVEITAQTSTDVTGVILSDGLKKTALTYDDMAKAWRGVYRVPLRTTANRLGLSLTAMNEHNRWQRVWIFLELGVDPTKTEESNVEPSDGC